MSRSRPGRFLTIIRIFENDDGREECPGLISPAHASGPSSNPSLHHARTLANLAYQRGFDGYLLNMEVGLKEGMEQARNLSIWISLLEEELRRAIGDHAQVVWYSFCCMLFFPIF